MRVPDPGSFQPFSRTPQNHCLQIASVISQYTAPPASQTMKQAIVSTGKQNFRPNINEISTSWTAYCYVQSAARAKCSATPVTTGLRRIWQECCGWNSVHGRCSCEDSVSTRTVRKRERERGREGKTYAGCSTSRHHKSIYHRPTAGMGIARLHTHHWRTQRGG